MRTEYEDFCLYLFIHHFKKTFNSSCYVYFIRYTDIRTMSPGGNYRQTTREDFEDCWPSASRVSVKLPPCLGLLALVRSDTDIANSEVHRQCMIKYHRTATGGHMYSMTSLGPLVAFEEGAPKGSCHPAGGGKWWGGRGQEGTGWSKVSNWKLTTIY